MDVQYRGPTRPFYCAAMINDPAKRLTGIMGKILRKASKY
jgi:hypothetical protein